MYNSGFYDTATVLPVDNEVLSIELENQIATKLDLMQFAHADYSLSENPGMVKKIRKYIGTGSVEELAMGQGNTEDFGAYWIETEYRVGTTQGRGKFYDEQAMADPTVIDKMVKHMAEEMTNDNFRKVVAEMNKTPFRNYGVAFNFDAVVDAIASFPDERTEDEAMFLLIARKDTPAWKKVLKDDLKYVTDYIAKGYIGHVAGVPVFWSDLIPQGKAFLGTKEAVEVMVKKGVEVETERDANVRENRVYTRKVQLVALTAPNKMIMISSLADPTTGKTQLLAEPANWATAYNSYFHIDVDTDTMVQNAFAEAPVFEPLVYFA